MTWTWTPSDPIGGMFQEHYAPTRVLIDWVTGGLVRKWNGILQIQPLKVFTHNGHRQGIILTIEWYFSIQKRVPPWTVIYGNYSYIHHWDRVQLSECIYRAPIFRLKRNLSFFHILLKILLTLSVLCADLFVYRTFRPSFLPFFKDIHVFRMKIDVYLNIPNLESPQEKL